MYGIFVNASNGFCFVLNMVLHEFMILANTKTYPGVNGLFYAENDKDIVSNPMVFLSSNRKSARDAGVRSEGVAA